MPHSSAALRLVTTRSLPHSRSESEMSSNSLTKLDDVLSSSPLTSGQETLGNLLQRLAIISPRSIAPVRRLVEHLLTAADTGGRGLYLLALVAFF